MPPLDPENDVTVYIVVEDFGQYGWAFRETDLAEADLRYDRPQHDLRRVQEPSAGGSLQHCRRVVP
jgi:hypothetical protein